MADHPAAPAELLDLSGQVAIVTGASRGLGEAIAATLHRCGAKVALVARSADDLERVSADLRCQPNTPDIETTRVYPVDVASEQATADMVADVLAAWGRVDILVNNAGLVSPGTLEAVDTAEWQRLIDANLTGAYQLIRAVAPSMQAQRHGRIVNISSISAQTGGISGGVHYAASKGGMLAMTKTLARDLGQYNVTVNSIAPGQIDSRPGSMVGKQRRLVESMIPLGRLGDPEDIANAVLYLVSRMGKYVTGATLDVNGGILKR